MSVSARAIIKGASVFTGDGRDPLDGLDVLIEGSRISSIEPTGSRADLEGWRVVRADGCTLMPGVVNAHAHVTLDEEDTNSPRRHNEHGDAATTLDGLWRSQRALRAGVTSIRECMAATDGIHDLRSAIEVGKFIGPTLLLCGRAVGAVGGHMSAITRQVSGVDEVRGAVSEEIAKGADFIKLCIDGSTSNAGSVGPALQLTSSEVSAAVEAAHDRGVAITSHATSTEAIDLALTCGVDSIEHGTRLDASLADRMATQGVWLVPTLSVANAMFTDERFNVEVRQRSRKSLDHGVNSLRLALAAGVKIAFGTDAGSPANHVWEIAPEFRLMEAAGMSRSDILRSATVGAATLAGIVDERGSIEAGKAADLLLIDGNPLSDWDAMLRVRSVWKNGAEVS